MKILLIFACLSFIQSTRAAWIPIYGADVAPNPPTTSDNLTIQASGDVSSTAWSIDRASARIGSDSVVLDIVFKQAGIGAPVITPWNHDEPIGALTSGSYNLTVNTWHGGSLADSLQTQFSVIPEPASVGLIGAGAFVAFLGRKRVNQPRHRAERRRF